METGYLPPWGEEAGKRQKTRKSPLAGCFIAIVTVLAVVAGYYLLMVIDMMVLPLLFGSPA